MRRILIVLLLVSVAACGDSGPTEPKRANVAGAWTYNVSNLSGSGFQCYISNLSMNINQTGSTFTGSASGGRAVCQHQGQPVIDQVLNTTIVNGTVSGNSVAFDFETSDFRNQGTLSGNSLSGTTSWRIDTGSGAFTLTGNFTAVKR